MSLERRPRRRVVRAGWRHVLPFLDACLGSLQAGWQVAADHDDVRGVREIRLPELHRVKGAHVEAVRTQSCDDRRGHRRGIGCRAA